MGNLRWYLVGSMDLNQKKEKLSDYRWRLGVIRYERVNYPWVESLGEERFPHTVESSSIHDAWRERGLEAQEDEEEVHRARKQVARCQWMLRGLAAGVAPGGLRSPDLPRAAATESVGVVFTGQVPRVRCGGRASVESGKKLLRCGVKGRSEMARVGGGGTGDSNVERVFGGEVVLVVCWEREGESTKERSLLVAQGL